MAAITSSPLTGYRVLVTRARSQAGALTDRLQRLGATVVELPSIEIAPADPEPLDSAICNVTRYDWIVFTSVNGVDAFLNRLSVHTQDAVSMSRVRIAAIGTATAQRLLDAGFNVDLMPDQFIAESVVAALASRNIDGQRILLPQAEIARDTVAEGLRRAGAIVDVVVAYRTILPDDYDSDHVQRLIAGVDVITFASPSSVRNMLVMADGRLPGVPVVCIGPVTANAASDAGLPVAGVADIYTTEGLVDAVVQFVERVEKGVPVGRHP
ncbi:MAG TPA: uroporphyrinogen-III synthase [Thermomicrobiales bacterium]|nr:uroporphyrinogen-III synthase [Thermomicrobiales bacterium]